MNLPIAGAGGGAWHELCKDHRAGGRTARRPQGGTMRRSWILWIGSTLAMAGLAYLASRLVRNHNLQDQ